MPRFNILAFSAVLPLLFIAGCNKAEKADANLKAAALVNGQVIAADQVQTEVDKIGQSSDADPKVVANLVLKNVIDQELLAQQAEKSKLADNPGVQWKLAAARRQILAEAELDVVTRDSVAPTDAEIKSYYDAHPELFSHHKLYRLANLVIDTTPGNIAKVRALAEKNTSAQALVTALQGQGIQVGGQQLVKAAEDLPKDMLEKLSGMKSGQSLILEQAGKLHVVMLEAMEEHPITLEQAKPSIGQYLLNDKKRKLLEAKLDALRSAAKIEYHAPYASVETK